MQVRSIRGARRRRFAKPAASALLVLSSFAGRAAAELVAQDRKGVDARIVAVAPPEAQPVPTDWLDVLDRDEHRNGVWLDPEVARPFVRTGRTGTMLAEIADRVHTFVTVAPLDAEHAVLDPVHVLGLDGLVHGLRVPP